MTKTFSGRYFEDFNVGETLVHATPRTVTSADATLYLALYGNRYPQFCADSFAQANGLERSPIDDLLAFHIVFGKSVPDISLNAVANLGYAEGRFHGALFAGATLHAVSEVIGVKQNSNGETGTVYVHTRGFDGDRLILEFKRWVMVRKRDIDAPAPETVVPEVQSAVDPSALTVPAGLRGDAVDLAATGSPYTFADYDIGEKIDHVDGMTVYEAEHRLATRLYQNTARVHFNDHSERAGRFGKCIVYGGHVISLARGLAQNGLGNVLHVAAINGGAHTNPCFAGDTVYAWSEVLDKAEISSHPSLGALRLRLVATKDTPASAFPLKGENGRYEPCVLLDFDYWALLPR